MTAAPARSHFVTAQDGLRLHVREWGLRVSARLPAVCLPGLTRNGADFEALASVLATESSVPRRVLALDLRGRGRSDYDPDPANYNVQVELADVLAVLTALGVAQTVLVGTSRGGILSMLLAAARPAALAGCVLNDIGPVLEAEGLARIKSYVGRMPHVASLEEAASGIRSLFGAQFPKLGDDDWLAFAGRTFKQSGNRIVADYDPKLATTLEAADPDRPLPDLWPQFDSLAAVPLLLIRGANSDLLSTATVAAMQARHPAMESIEVPDQGHAPLLAEPPLIARIAAFMEACDARMD